MHHDKPPNELLAKTTVAALGPGARLRMAREAIRLGQAELAGILRLRLDIIEAIENDDVDSIAARVFVRGYLRSYAKAVRIDPEEIISAFNAQVKADTLRPILQPEPLSERGFDMTQGAKGSHKVYVIGVVVVALIVAGWYMRANNKHLGNLLPKTEVPIAASSASSGAANSAAHLPGASGDKSSPLHQSQIVTAMPIAPMPEAPQPAITSSPIQPSTVTTVPVAPISKASRPATTSHPVQLPAPVLGTPSSTSADVGD